MNAPFEACHIQPLPVAMPFLLGEVNMYLYDGGGTLTLFDAAVPTEDAWQVLQQALAARGAAARDIRRVVLTHHHFDHTGLTGRVIDESGAELCGHPELPLQAGLSYTFDDAYNAWLAALLEVLGV